VIRLKRRIGMVYGMVVGLSFTAASWGIDGYLLSRANGFYPWLKFIIGAAICMTAAGLAGWFVARSEKAILGLLFYLAVAFVFSWLILALPFQIFPKAVTLLDPEVGNMLNYPIYEGFRSRFWVAAAWVSVFVALVGLLQIPLAEPAAFATSVFGKVAPLLVCSVVMFINGFIVDSINNEPLRNAVLNMNTTIQYAVDHQGQEVDRAEARKMRISSLRAVQDVIDEPRQLIVGTYDQYLDQIHVLVRFGTTWTDCVVVYNQPSFCKYVETESP
ncbi:MAG TPA: hypothetical protein VJ785_12015, partial [Anaerolineales bacterium]|nr:hypothetical protein [Anaerolineales bacterium]